MMSGEEKMKLQVSIRKIMAEYEGRVAGKMDLVFLGSAPDGSDETTRLDFPDWNRIGSIPASQP